MWQSLSMGNSVIGVVALTGVMMRPEVEVAPEVLWDWGVATMLHWGVATRKAITLYHTTALFHTTSVCHTLFEENQCPPP